MKHFNIGGIFSIYAPDEAVCKKGASGYDIEVLLGSTDEPIRFYLFQDLGENRMDWSYRTLSKHVEESIGPPFQTSVQQVEGESWIGYQAVTALGETQFLVNRVLASKVSDDALRIEFNVTREDISETWLEILESVEFGPGE